MIKYPMLGELTKEQEAIMDEYAELLKQSERSLYISECHPGLDPVPAMMFNLKSDDNQCSRYFGMPSHRGLKKRA